MENDEKPQVGDLVLLNIPVKLLNTYGKTSFIVEYMDKSFIVHSQDVLRVLDTKQRKSK